MQRLSRIVFWGAMVPALSSAWAWGFEGHRRLAAHLHDAVPAGHCVRQWLASIDSSAQFQERTTEPDRWRAQTQNGQPNPNYDANEAPRHYLEMDWITPAANYPRDWAMAQQQLGFYAVRNGQVPWRVQELYDEWVEEMRKPNNNQAVASLSAHLSHYVTDAASILHNTKNFDPKLSETDTVGLHTRWESDMLENSSRLNGITTQTAKYIGTPGTLNPTQAIFDLVLAGNGLVDALIAADKKSQGSLSLLYTETQDMTARRWGDALTLYGSLAVSAWVEAGRPRLDGMKAGCDERAFTSPVVLKGNPLPPNPRPPDAGTFDSGVPDAGGPTPSDLDAGVTGEVNPERKSPVGSCGGTSAALWLPLGSIVVGVWASRSRRVSGA